MNNVKTYIVCWLMVISAVFCGMVMPDYDDAKTAEEFVSETTLVIEQETTAVDILTTVHEKTEETTSVECIPIQQKTQDNLIYSEDEIELLALVTVAEAEGESEYGKRLVIDTILNRVDAKSFPNTIRGVIY